MTTTLPEIDQLRSRLAAPELAEARRVAGTDGIAGLVEHARRALEEALAARARFDGLSRQLNTSSAGERARSIERFLRETSTSIEGLKADLRALHSGRPGVLDLAALGERIGRREDRCERRAEVSLALAKAMMTEANASTLDIAKAIELARLSGRWSRRVEALRLLGEVAPHVPPGLGRDAIVTAARELAARSEHRWVQPEALATLAKLDLDGARALAQERLEHPDGGDDFLVRAAIVRLVSRFGDAEWSGLLAFAQRDPSDLVRMEAASGEKGSSVLVRIAREDVSHKVRAVALITLAKRAEGRAEAALRHAVIHDQHGFVVQTAAEELVALARKGQISYQRKLVDALALGATRPGIGSTANAACRDALAEIDVTASQLLNAARLALARIIADTPPDGAVHVESATLALLTDEQVGRVLSVLSRDDFALGVDRTKDGINLYRGDVRSFAPWRAIFEALHPAPSKRQAFDHTWGRKPRGALRAPPGGMAELTATRVPGERVFIDRLGEWGRHLPLVDDFLSTGVFVPKKVTLMSAFGAVTLVPPASFASRLGAWLKLTRSYSWFADLRCRSLESEEPTTQQAYLVEIARASGIRAQSSPYTFTTVDTTVQLPCPAQLVQAAPSSMSFEPSARVGQAAAMLAFAGTSVDGAFSDLMARANEIGHEFLAYVAAPGGNRLPHLAAYALVLFGGMVVRSIGIRRAIERDRRAIPLVVGGWGTRGKSGTERLKAALFQGLGHEVLVKTTGCEAMFIHAIPGVPAREIFLYRPYDKATIWEQWEALRLARRFGVRVFLWECMALQPDLVTLLQQQWMQDDYSTITNAYPDHEDIQGPAGIDVATVISEFTPRRGKLFTAEEQMLPILRERAKERGTTLRSVSARDAELIADDLLARFPYQEHPKNIALVAALARAFGVPATVAVAEMADNVVPDLGVLKTYPTIPWRGRMLSFTNGMSANERTGALANWRRTGFDQHDPDNEPARWLVTVVNNRADRIARSDVFARFIVEDIAAHRHVLIGTNVVGLVGFIRGALDSHIIALSLVQNLAGDAAERLRTAEARVRKAFAQLKVSRTDAASVLAECHALGFPELPPDLIERLLQPSQPGEPFEAGKDAVEKGIPSTVSAEHRPFLVSMIARRRAVCAIMMLLHQRLESDAARVDKAFGATYRALFEDGLVPLYDSSLTGDQLITRIAELAPPRAHVSIMGIQNIKGTGLDFVYRWVSVDVVHRSLDAIESPLRERRVRALRDLFVHDDYGLVDAGLALAKVEEARGRYPEDAALCESVAVKLRSIVETRTKRLTAKSSMTVLDRLRSVIGETLDFVDAIRRRRMASSLLDSLVAEHISHATAAIRMREIVARSKGAWMKKRS